MYQAYILLLTTSLLADDTSAFFTS